jgi:hypothetical protein
MVRERQLKRWSAQKKAALISGPVIFAIEFKVGESDYRRADINQVWDYALDLKNFHKGSHDAPIVPILPCRTTGLVPERCRRHTVQLVSRGRRYRVSSAGA